MLGKVCSAAVTGIKAELIDVEADISAGIPNFDMTGNLSKTAMEAKDRVRTAIRNSGINMRPARITVNMSPAQLRKDGAHYDLAVAVAVLGASGIINMEALSDVMILGELGLDGSVNSVRSVLPMVIAASEREIPRCIVPAGNLKEARYAGKLHPVGIRSLKECVEYLRSGKEPVIDVNEEQPESMDTKKRRSFDDIKGQQPLKRALMIAAAGMHNILLIGPPGSGKSMSAEAIPSILPKLSEKEQLEVSQIYSVAGLLTDGKGFVTERPFRSPLREEARIRLRES